MSLPVYVDERNFIGKLTRRISGNSDQWLYKIGELEDHETIRAALHHNCGSAYPRLRQLQSIPSPLQHYQIDRWVVFKLKKEHFDPRWRADIVGYCAKPQAKRWPKRSSRSKLAQKEYLGPGSSS